MKNEYVAPVARLVNKSFDVDFDAITAFDPSMESPFEHNWQKLMDEVEALVLPEVVTRLMTDQKGIKNAAMADQSPLLKVLAIRITMAIAKDTIKQSLKSFMLDKLNLSINQLNAKKYTVAITATMEQINKPDNLAALIAIGFTQIMIDKLNENSKKIKNAQDEFDALKITRKNLSHANLLSIKQLETTTALVCKSGVCTFSLPKDTEKIDQYTITKVLASVRPTPPVEPRDRHIAATKSICIKTKPAKKDTLQMTLMSDVTEPIYYCMCDLKTGVCTTGGVLQYNVTTTILQKDITGSGVHLVISNSNLVNILVKTFTVKG
jgi:hypothetical protein